MTALKLHYDGWLKLPVHLQRALGAATGDLLEVEAGRGGLVLRVPGAAPAAATPTAEPAAPAPDPVSAAAETSGPRKRGRPRKAEVAPAAESLALPPGLRAAGRRKPRAG
jgi:hypothetical protein